MKIIRNRLRYDLDAAQHVFTYTDELGTDYRVCITKKGNWFRWNEVHNDFEPLSIDQVIDIMEKKGMYDLIEEFFEDIIGDA